MTTLRRHVLLSRCCLAAVFVVALPACAARPVLEFHLNGSLEGRAGEQKLMAQLAPGAKFVQSAEGQGLAPGPKGPAVIIPVPDNLWKSAGTLAFRFRPSRTVRFAREKALSTALVSCPVFRILLMERKRHLILRAAMAHDGTEKDRRVLRASTRGQVSWSHLKGGEWYHFAFTWDAAAGRMDTYLNGSIQQEMRLVRRWHPWRPPAKPTGALEIGGAFGQGGTEARFAVDSVRLYAEFMDEARLAATLKGRSNFTLRDEGRWDLEGSLDLSPYKLTLVYANDFDKPLNFIHEKKLFAPGGMYKPLEPAAKGRKRRRPQHDNKRVAEVPRDAPWVLEGGGQAWTDKGRCHVKSDRNQVLWNTREFPANFLLEFGMSPINHRCGLTIIFFATRNLRGGSPWEMWMKSRDGDFRTYHSRELNCYHCSYWACNPFDGGILRRTTNLRKNCGFFMPATGIDRIGGRGPGPHRVRLLKVGGKIRLETNGRLSLVFDDDGKTYGPVWKDGWIGLRQMGHSKQVSYTHFKVWKVEPR